MLSAYIQLNYLTYFSIQTEWEKVAKDPVHKVFVSSGSHAKELFTQLARTISTGDTGSTLKITKSSKVKKGVKNNKNCRITHRGKRNRRIFNSRAYSAKYCRCI